MQFAQYEQQDGAGQCDDTRVNAVERLCQPPDGDGDEHGEDDQLITSGRAQAAALLLGQTARGGELLGVDPHTGAFPEVEADDRQQQCHHRKTVGEPLDERDRAASERLQELYGQLIGRSADGATDAADRRRVGNAQDQSALVARNTERRGDRDGDGNQHGGGGGVRHPHREESRQRQHGGKQPGGAVPGTSRDRDGHVVVESRSPHHLGQEEPGKEEDDDRIEEIRRGRDGIGDPGHHQHHRYQQ